MSTLDCLLVVSFCLSLGGASALAFRLAITPALPRPLLGARGLKRANALRGGGAFGLVEPLIRTLAAWLPASLLNPVRHRMHVSLNRAGDYLGLSPDELIASSILSGVCFGVLPFLLCDVLTLPHALAAVGACLGTIAPSVRVVTVAQARARNVDRGLPSAVELAAMCMGAGLDFPGSLRQIIDSAADSDEPIVEEFARILRELDLGHTRKRALDAFAERVPTAAVRELVNSVAQAEEKGTPLANVLTIQAQTQRLRRSVAAEQSASAAALMLLGPMTLIFICVIVLLLGPVVVRFMTGGLAPS